MTARTVSNNLPSSSDAPPELMSPADFNDIVAQVVATCPFERRAPWSPRDEDAAEHELRHTVGWLGGLLNVEVHTEFNHYGSGYASFVHAWFPAETVASRAQNGLERDIGLAVVLSRLAPVYCLFEGERATSSNGAAWSELPCFENVDNINTEGVAPLATRVEAHLTRVRYRRLRKSALADLLPPGVSVPTVLNVGPYRVFDALFHWED